LVGRNCSGKSTILEALSFLPDPDINDPFRKTSKYTFVKDLHSGKPLVYGYSGTAKLEYLSCSKDITRNVRINIRDEKSPDLFIDEKEFGEPVGKLAELMKMNKEEIQNCVFFIPNSTDFMRKIENLIINENFRDKINKIGANLSVARAVSNCIHEKFTEVIVETLSVRKELPDKVFYIKLSDLGDGIEKAIKIMLILETLKPKLVIWDDFESSAHPSLIEILLNWLIKKDWQVVISTHSIDVLYELIDMKDGKNVNTEDVTVLLLEKMDDDVLVYEKLSFDELEDLIIANQDPRIVSKVLQLR